MSFSHISQEILSLQKQISELKQSISHAPDGHLICCNGKTNTKWYQSNGHSRVYIPKGNRTLAESLAIKKYYSLLLEELFSEKKALEQYQRFYPYKKRSQELLLQPGYADLLKVHFTPTSREFAEWMSTPYKGNPSHPENLIHETLSGHLVRSKSEAMIDSLLFTNKIPFRYEEPLLLDGIVLYPDFSTRHPVTGKSIYWEHFGMMDDPTYSKHAANKLQTYISYGIIPTIDLITTYETKQSPLTLQTIQKIIDHYYSS